MLSSSFNENVAPLLPGERKLYTIVVEEADFVTVYWLLKWVYANWLLFRKDDDPRQAVDGIGAGWSARDLCAPGVADEWGWKVFHKGGAGGAHSDTHSGGVSDTRSVTSGASGRSTGDVPRDKPGKSTSAGSAMRGAAAASTAKTQPSPTIPRAPPTPRRVSSNAPPGLAVPLAAQSPSASGTTRSAKPVPVPLSPSATHYPRPHAGKSRAGSTGAGAGGAGTADPHAHPTRAPAEALKPFLDTLSTYVRAFDAPEQRARADVEFIKDKFGYPEEDITVRHDVFSLGVFVGCGR